MVEIQAVHRGDLDLHEIALFSDYDAGFFVLLLLLIYLEYYTHGMIISPPPYSKQ